NDRREELTNYELNSKTISTISDGYRIEALTVAVVINRKRLLSVIGENADAATLEAHLRDIEQLVGAAVGLTAERGDRITVAAVDFCKDGEPLEPLGISFGELLLSQSGTIVNALAIVAATALLVWLGLRPALKAVLEPVAAGPSIPGKRLEAGDGPPMAGEPTLSISEPMILACHNRKHDNTTLKRYAQVIEYDE